MALADGEPARDGDTWFRIASHKDHIKNGRAQHGAFKGTAISAPDPAKNRPWDRDLSGRLRSIAGTREDVIKHAIDFCDEQSKAGGGTKTFMGVMYAPTADLATEYENRVKTLVVYTGWDIPTTKEALEEFYIWLSDQLQVLHYQPRETGHSQLEFFPDAVDTRMLSEKLSDAISGFLFRKK
jgi:hypothetical protein